MKTSKSNIVDMTVGSPVKHILAFALPLFIGNLFQQFYNMVDTIIVGRYLGEEALAAVGSTGCLMFLVLGFANGIAQGFGVMVSHAYGAEDKKLLKHYVALSLLLTVIVSVLLTAFTVAGARQLLMWMNTPENILELANDYIQVIFAGILLLVYMPVTLWMRSRQSLKASPVLSNPLHYHVDKDGITVTQGESSGVLAWKQIYKMVSTKHLVLIYSNRINAYVIPRSQLGEQYVPLAKLATDKLPKFRVKMKVTIKDV